jgi:hypothetical protein
LKIAVSGTDQIVLLLSSFKLPKNATVHVFNPSMTQVLGAFTEINNSKGENAYLPIEAIYDDTLIIQYHQPKVIQSKKVPFNIETVYIGVGSNTNITQYSSLNNNNCHVEINCIEGDYWRPVASAVTRMTLYTPDGIKPATAFLINRGYGGFNNYDDSYIATAYHNLADFGSNVYNIPANFKWFFESDQCGSQFTSNVRTTSNAVLLSRDSYSDFALLRLDENPLITLPTNIIWHFLGWDRRTPIGNTGNVHHPANLRKMVINVDASPVSNIITASNNQTVESWSLTMDKAAINGVYYNEPGSSGSP